MAYFLAQVVERPQEPLSRVFVDFDDLWCLPFIVAVSDKDEVVSVEPYAEHSFQFVAEHGPHVVETILQLFDDLLATGGVSRRSKARAWSLGVLVFDYHAAIDGICTTASNGEFMFTFKLDAGRTLDEG